MGPSPPRSSVRHLPCLIDDAHIGPVVAFVHPDDPILCPSASAVESRDMQSELSSAEARRPTSFRTNSGSPIRAASSDFGRCFDELRIPCGWRFRERAEESGNALEAARGI
jgi:hypothetical protein